ncbi:hypothetical protein CR513_53069, partial [Mucuna pruriens]
MQRKLGRPPKTCRIRRRKYETPKKRDQILLGSRKTSVATPRGRNGFGLLVAETPSAHYDPSQRTDFQIAPTLEEYERLLELPLEASPQYFHRGQTPSWSSMAKLLKVTKTRIIKERKSRNGVEGIYKSYLQERLYQFRQDEDWPAFMDAYGLLIYGIVLFPHGDDFIDLVLHSLKRVFHRPKVVNIHRERPKDSMSKHVVHMSHPKDTPHPKASRNS